MRRKYKKDGGGSDVYQSSSTGVGFAITCSDTPPVPMQDPLCLCTLTRACTMWKMMHNKLLKQLTAERSGPLFLISEHCYSFFSNTIPSVTNFQSVTFIESLFAVSS